MILIGLYTQDEGIVVVQTYLEIDGYARKVPPVSFRPRTDL